MIECPKCSFVPPNPRVQFCPNCGARRVVEKAAKVRATETTTDAPAGKGKRNLIVAAVVATLGLIYMGSYLVMTLGGHGQQVMSGGYRDQTGTPVVDVEQWQPSGVELSRYREMSGGMVTHANAPGWVFLPMVMADRRWWHKTKSLVTRDVNHQ